MKKTVVNIALVLVSIMVVLAAVESLLARFHPHKVTATATPGHERSFFCRYHPVLGWENKPDYRGTVKIDDAFQFAVTHNSRGLRGPEYPYERTGEKRILVLGDSFAWGFGVQDREVFSRVIEELNPALEVVNMGVSGYGTDQELLSYTEEGYKYSPDLVLLLFYSNDIVDISSTILFGYPKSVFLPGSGPLQTANIPVPRSKETERLFGNSATVAGRFSNYLKRRTHTYPFIVKRLNSVPWLHDVFLRMGLAEGPIKELPGVPYLVIEDEREKWNLFFRLVREFQAAAGEGGAKFLLVNVPAREQPPNGSPVYSGLDLSPQNYEDNNTVSRNLRGFAARYEVPLLDMLPVVRAGEAQGTRYYSLSTNDIHLSAAGHRLLAHSVTQWLKEQGFP